MKSKIVVLLMVGFAIAAGVSSYYGRANLAEALNAKKKSAPEAVAGEAITIMATPIALNSEDVSQTTIGELTFLKGWELSSDNEGFGGWSGLVMDGHKLVAISDQGNWLQTTMEMSQEPLILEGNISLFDPSVGKADKTDFDAESLVSVSDGYVIGLEQEHRLMKVANIGAKAESYETGVDLSGLSKNGGIEAMTMLPNGNLLMFAENGRDTNGKTSAWLVTATGNQEIAFYPPENFEATDAATLPNGDVLLLMRYYSVIEGVSAQIRHITASEIASGTVKGRQIAEMKEPMSVDNMEGLDVQTLPDGTVRLFMISDDNFSSRQRTLFMVFDWPKS